jgi:hypothetical protein
VNLTLDERRDLQLELQEMERRLLECLADVRRASELAAVELREASRADLNLRSLDARRVPAPRQVKTTVVTLGELRDAAIRMRRFVPSELAAELGCTTREARVHLTRIGDVVTLDGDAAGEPLYQCVLPAGFEAVDESTRVVVGDMRARRRQEIKQTMVGMVKCAELRPIVSDALADGWRLVHRPRAKHPLRLVRDGRQPIGLPSTPRSPSMAAKRLRDQLEAAS